MPEENVRPIPAPIVARAPFQWRDDPGRIPLPVPGVPMTADQKRMIMGRDHFNLVSGYAKRGENKYSGGTFLRGKDVYVVGRDELVVKLFEGVGAKVTTIINPHKTAELLPDPHLVVFTGGSDVTPWLYGAVNTASGNNFERDVVETLWFHRFLKIPKVGICRGGQFLNVMSGGTMDQDIQNHGRTHEIVHTNYLVAGSSVTSTHHQHMVPENTKGHSHVLAVSSDNRNEIISYTNTNSLCFQPHPEYEHKETALIFWQYLGVNFSPYLTADRED